MCSILTLLCISKFCLFLGKSTYATAFWRVPHISYRSKSIPVSLFTFNLLLNQGCTNHLPDIRSLSKLVQEAGLLIWQDSVRDSSPDYPVHIQYAFSHTTQYDIFTCWPDRLINHKQKQTKKQKWNFKTPHSKEQSICQLLLLKVQLYLISFLLRGHNCSFFLLSGHNFSFFFYVSITVHLFSST